MVSRQSEHENGARNGAKTEQKSGESCQKENEEPRSNKTSAVFSVMASNNAGVSSLDLIEVDQQETSCGIQISCCSYKKRYGLKPLQNFASQRWALAFLCAAYFFSEGTVSGVFNANISTVEKQFQLRTIESGLIGGFQDLGAFLAVTISSYFGDKILKPLWMGYGALTCGAGSVVFALPQFTSPAYSYGDEFTNYCGNVTEPSCSASSLRDYKYVFMLGSVLNGFGAQYMMTLGTSYMDENVKQTSSSLYNGIFFAVGGALGPAAAFLLSGMALEVFNDPTKSVSITASSSLWVGAWWLSYVASGIGLLLFATPVILLPRYLPGTKSLRKNREQMRATATDKNSRSNFRNFLQMFISLLKNRVYISLTLADAMHSAFLYGFLTYSVKIGVHIFGLPESTSSYYLGLCAIGAATSGYFLGGFVVTKFKFTLRGILLFMIGASTVALIFCFALLFECPEIKFAGATLPYPNQTLDGDGTTVECNRACGCDTDLFNPVCDDRGVTYFSPCHAGCHAQVNDTFFTDCACVEGVNSTEVSRENCPEKVCSNFPWILVILFVCFFCGYLGAAPSAQATMRCVAFNQRTAALSIQRIFTIIFGRIIGRLLLGEVMGQACLLSSTECGEVGACRSYTRKEMARNITILLAVERAMCAMFAVAAWIFYCRRKDNIKH